MHIRKIYFEINILCYIAKKECFVADCNIEWFLMFSQEKNQCVLELNLFLILINGKVDKQQSRIEIWEEKEKNHE